MVKVKAVVAQVSNSLIFSLLHAVESNGKTDMLSSQTLVFTNPKCNHPVSRELVRKCKKPAMSQNPLEEVAVQLKAEGYVFFISLLLFHSDVIML